MINEKYAREYCSEDISLIENYDKAISDTTQIWVCHHRLEIQGCFYNSPALLDKCGIYKKVPAWQLVFLTKAEHKSLHGRNRSAKTLAKMAEAKKGKNHPLFGKHHTEETKSKMAAAKKGKHHTEEAKSKISEARRLWWQR